MDEELFKLPEELPTELNALSELRSEAQAAFDAIKTKVEAGEDLTDEELEHLKYVVDSIAQIDAATAAAEDSKAARNQSIADLIKAGEGEDGEDDESEDGDADKDGETDADEKAAADVVAEAEKATEEAAKEGVSASAKAPARRTKFSGIAKGKTPAVPKSKEIGWQMNPEAHGYKSGHVGFAELAAAVEGVRPGARARSNRPVTGGYAQLAIASITRDIEVVDDPHELVAAIEKATDESRLPGGSLTAAGGWCAPSETLYDFCEVPSATDLLSLPEITIRRGGVRWPVEPDLSAIFESFQFFFTEPELEAVDGEGNPTAVKECVEIPCPDEFEELRLNVVGYCVEAGILQTQGWPELIEWFMRSLVAEHLRAISRRSILDMVAGSTPVIIPATTQIAAGSSLLNSLSLMAVNLRLNKGLGRTATIEGVAPSWLHELVRADLANQQGTETKNVTDSQITAWFSARNIALQFVGDWQTREAGQPGNLATVEYPATVQVLLYPAGTWFRALSNVIELGVQYPRELLQVNRYTRFFTEDAIAIGKRCNESLVVTVPVCPNGAYGEQDAITCNTAANEVQTLTVTGTPTGGTIPVTFLGQGPVDVDFDATAAEVKTALATLSNLDAADLTTGGGPLPGTPVTVEFTGRYAGGDVPKLGVSADDLTGGTDPTVTVTSTTTGGS